MSKKVLTIVISIVAVIIAAVSYVLNMGWIRFFMIFLMTPFIHAVGFIAVNIIMADYLDKSRKMKWLNLLFILTFLMINIFMPDCSDYGDAYFFFGLIKSDSLSTIAEYVAWAAVLGHIATFVLQMKTKRDLERGMMVSWLASGAMTVDSSKKSGSEIPEGFEKLLDSARKKVSENCTVGSQAIVMETANNLLYCRVIAYAAVDGGSGEMALIEEVKTSCDTEVRRIVCMWHDGTVDLPSYNLRKALVELNPANAEAQILLNGGMHYIVKALKDTM